MKRPTIKIQYDAPVALSFALLCLIAFLVNKFTLGWANSEIFSVYRSSLSDPLTYVRLFTHVLGHTDFNHFFSNMSLFLVLSAIVENKYGSVKLLISIIITAFVSGFIHFVFFPATALLGASGIVFMMIFLASMANSKNGVIPVSLILVAAIYLGKEIWALFLTNDNISQLTHIIGGVCGIIFGKYSKR
ncbi:MAG: rhomboid family intramembrane serine protease [Clostridia bacterium]|nr:rhomboid family intramembrane serine protease [Clostridia bacterium]MBR6650176.1 rhomboid family intramembrane serine protease [Clostridia bacterium]